MYDEVTLEVHGNLCREPERKVIPNDGTEVLEMCIASSFAPRRDKDGNKVPPKDGKKPEPFFTIIEIYDPWTRRRAEEAKVGCKVYAKGRAKVNTWVDKASGKPRHKLICVPGRLYILPKPEMGDEPTL